ncbi:MAG: hypothetical protein JST60_12260 [Chloroflexi bacterium SZAS-1]|nr:hypothetical protein [Chloroflexi bacterium SZAS-1]
MKPSTRAFAGAALFWLALAALLHVLAVLGRPGAWGAMVHTLLFGWITSMIVTVNYHTVPVFSGRDFPSQPPIWAHWWLLAGGVALAVAGQLADLPVLSIAGIAGELAAALCFMLNIVLLLRYGPARPRMPAPPIANQPQIDRLGTQATRASGMCLPLALVLLLGARSGWPGEWVLAAEHLAALGWIMLMIVGVSYHVLPRFSGQGVRPGPWVRAQLACHFAAVLLMVPALGFGWGGLFAVGGTLMAVALGLFAWTIWPALRPVLPRPGVISLAVREARHE